MVNKVKRSPAKKLYEKMTDFKRFAILLLAVGSFFYLGVIIPRDEKILMDQTIMMSASMLFLAGSIFFFTLSNKAKTKLDEIADQDEYVIKK